MEKPGLLKRLLDRVIPDAPTRLMRKVSAEKLKVVLKGIRELSAVRIKLLEGNMADVLRLFDASQFCLMYEADLTILTRDMCCHSDEWEQRLYGRLLAMTMLECVDDVPTVLGKEFRKSLSAVMSDDMHRQRTNRVSGKLTDFRKRHERRLRSIRQIAAAHRDHDPNLITKVIENIDVSELMLMSVELSDLLAEFARAMGEVIPEIDFLKELRTNSPKRRG